MSCQYNQMENTSLNNSISTADIDQALNEVGNIFPKSDIMADIFALIGDELKTLDMDIDRLTFPDIIRIATGISSRIQEKHNITGSTDIFKTSTINATHDHNPINNEENMEIEENQTNAEYDNDHFKISI